MQNARASWTSDEGQLLARRSGTLLDWRASDKAMVLVLLPAPVLVVAWIRGAFILSDPSDAPYVSRATLASVGHGIEAYFVAVALAAVYWVATRRTRPESAGLVAASLTLFFIAESTAAYVVGQLSTTVLSGAVSGSMVVLLLFERRSAIIGVCLGNALVFAPIAATAFRFAPYAPLYEAPPFVGPFPPIAWLATTTLFGIVLTTTPCVLSIVLLDRWSRNDAALRRLACLDGLTELSNRRHFLARLGIEMERALRRGSTMALVLIDLDHFKRINDRLGHQAGDAVLVGVARRLSGAVRRVDTVGRLGGEEFALLLPETELDDAVRTAERVRAALAERAFELGGTYVHATASLGVAIHSSSRVETLDQLVKRADDALYRAKAAGRNRIEPG